MLDILHYLFETEAVAEKEVHDARTKMRQMLYGQLYERSYTWGGATPAQEFGTQEVGSGGAALTHKPYVPPTPVNPASAKPYGNVLDAPLG